MTNLDLLAPRVCAGMRLEEIQVLEEKGQSLHLDR